MTTSASGTVERVKWSFGNTEVWYDEAGDIEKTFANASLDGNAVRIVDGSEVEHLFHDPRGNLLASVGEDGALQGGFSYGPYGELLEEVGSNPDDLLRRFNGKEYDSTSGLAYYGYRYFDERALTWTQADPMYRFVPDKSLFEPRRGNLYAFVQGNPVRLVDPDGRDTCQAIYVSWSLDVIAVCTEPPNNVYVKVISPTGEALRATEVVTEIAKKVPEKIIDWLLPPLDRVPIREDVPDTDPDLGLPDPSKLSPEAEAELYAPPVEMPTPERLQVQKPTKKHAGKKPKDDGKKPKEPKKPNKPKDPPSEPTQPELKGTLSGDRINL